MQAHHKKHASKNRDSGTVEFHLTTCDFGWVTPVATWWKVRPLCGRLEWSTPAQKLEKGNERGILDVYGLLRGYPRTLST